MMNVNKTMADMAVMSDQQLKQTAVMNKADPYMIALLSGESARRQAIRQGAQARTQAQPTVVDQRLAQMDVGQAQAMPEDQGIARLRTPNMETMAAAEGGIVGYADGGMVAFAKGGRPNTDAFENAFQTVLRLEGGAKFVANDAGKGPTKYGINQTANPDIDVKNLTEAQARDIYRKRYWDKINGDTLAAKNPELAKIAFDAAVNQGTGPANKMVAAADGDPAKLLEMRKQRYDALTASNPEKYTPFSKGWDKRLASLATAAIPIGSAQAETEKTGIASVAPADTAPKKETPAAGQEGIDPYAVATALGGLATLPYAGSIPATVKESLAAQFKPGTTAGKAIGRVATAGVAVPLAVGMGGATAAQNATDVMAGMSPENRRSFYSNPMIGAMGGDASFAAAIMNAAEEKQDPNAKPPMSYADQMANVGKFIVGHPDVRDVRKYVVPEEAKPAGGIPDLVEGSKEDFRRSELEAQSKAESPIQAPAPVADAAAAAGEKPSWLTNDRALMMGLHLLAGSGKPGSGSAIRDLLSGLGTAGLGTLAQEKEERKAKATEAETLAKGKYYGAYADSIERGAKEKNEVQLAEKTAQDAVDNWAKNNKMALLQTPGLYEQMRNKYRMEAYNQYGISMQSAAGATGATGAPTARTGWGVATAS